jgi:hypothetical protein
LFLSTYDNHGIVWVVGQKARHHKLDVLGIASHVDEGQDFGTCFDRVFNGFFGQMVIHNIAFAIEANHRFGDLGGFACENFVFIQHLQTGFALSVVGLSGF